MTTTTTTTGTIHTVHTTARGQRRMSWVRCLLLLPLGVLLLEHVWMALWFYGQNPTTTSTTSTTFVSPFVLSPVDDPSFMDNNQRVVGVVPGNDFKSLLLLETTAGTSTKECRAPLVRVDNVLRDSLLSRQQQKQQQQVQDHDGSNSTSIPRIIHQTAKSSCLTPPMARATQSWQAWPDWSYVLHTDEDMERLVQYYAPHFPHLADIWNHCLRHGTMRADIWRYLVLWVYGGVYADIDAVPTAEWTPALLANQDAFFVVEQYHLLSQYFMAVTPKHPLMWYALQTAIANVLRATDTGGMGAALHTGPHALHQAFMAFCRDANAGQRVVIDEARPGNKPVRAGTYMGTYNRTVTVVGVAEHQNQYIDRDVLGSRKTREYHKVGMTFHLDDKKELSGRSCLRSIMDAYYYNSA